MLIPFLSVSFELYIPKLENIGLELARNCKLIPEEKKKRFFLNILNQDIKDGRKG